MDLFEKALKKAAASIPGAEVNIPAPNYRPAENPELESCSTCKFRDEAGKCQAFAFGTILDHVCDAWQPVGNLELPPA